MKTSRTSVIIVVALLAWIDAIAGYVQILQKSDEYLSSFLSAIFLVLFGILLVLLWASRKGDSE